MAFGKVSNPDLDETKALHMRANSYMEDEQYKDAVRYYRNVMKNDQGNM